MFTVSSDYFRFLEGALPVQYILHLHFTKLRTRIPDSLKPWILHCIHSAQILVKPVRNSICNQYYLFFLRFVFQISWKRKRGNLLHNFPHCVQFYGLFNFICRSWILVRQFMKGDINCTILITPCKRWNDYVTKYCNSVF